MREERKFWHVGIDKEFVLSKDRCQKFLFALTKCNGHITDCYCTSYGKDDPPHRHDAQFAISLPVGKEELYESIMGPGFLSEPPKIGVFHER